MEKTKVPKKFLFLIIFFVVVAVSIFLVLSFQKDSEMEEDELGGCLNDGETFSFMDNRECCEGLMEQLINRSVSVCTTQPCAGEGEEVNRNPLQGEPYDTPCCPTLVEDQESKSYSICRAQIDSD